MRGLGRWGTSVVASALVAAVGLALGPPAASAQPFTKRTLHFDVAVGPSGNQHCNIVGDLYKPRSASPSHRAPAILTTNGFGGSKDDQADIGRPMASPGHVVLSYSGTGLGRRPRPIPPD